MEALPLDSKVALIIGNHAGVREMVCGILESRRCVVQRADGALDPLAFAESGMSFDLVVLVVVQPGTSVTLIDLLLKRQPDLKVLLITGRADGSELPAFAGMPNVRLLEKPFDPTELIDSAEGLFEDGHRVRMAASPRH
jgi:DNA-binding NtrC family response regulator